MEGMGEKRKGGRRRLGKEGEVQKREREKKGKREEECGRKREWKKKWEQRQNEFKKGGKKDKEGREEERRREKEQRKTKVSDRGKDKKQEVKNGKLQWQKLHSYAAGAPKWLPNINALQCCFIRKSNQKSTEFGYGETEVLVPEWQNKLGLKKKQQKQLMWVFSYLLAHYGRGLVKFRKLNLLGEG